MSLVIPNSASAGNFEHFTAGSLMGFRDFYLYNVPSGHPAGLVVMLHGCKTDASEFNEGTEMSKYAVEKNLAVLYPEQSVLANMDRCWNWFWGTENTIIAEGVRQVQERFHLNRDHTYLMGMSAGAAQAAIMANCNRDLFSGVLIHSGLQYLAAENIDDAQTSLQNGSYTTAIDAAKRALECESNNKPVRFMVVYGTADLRVNPINGKQAADEMLKLNELLAHKSHAPAVVTTTDKDVAATAPLLSYHEQDLFIDGALTGTVLEVNGLAHEWSGGNPIQPRNNPNGPNVIELFFQKFL